MLCIYEDVKGKRYHQLIDLLARQCDRFAFVENRQLMDNDEDRLAYVEYLIADINVHLIERKVQREWETTKLLKDTAYVYYFHLNNSTKAFLKDRSKSLFGWITELPEDLMFYKGDTCVLAACSHEGFFMVDGSLWNSFNKR
ncbi:stage III sporulation protein AH [Fictibacillus aquaticus]|uniref:Stage III sporulation protein AH n=1 Tax=Fictibacillus aquaticus TaxID=2021314 RepID=A0A235FDA8_9BACL|nr:stage III sporulation protein AH [Fictibacillus aquaticus]OYD59336.1 stage III sporulation protein AH [Fictibacillus aquaticus]